MKRSNIGINALLGTLLNQSIQALWIDSGSTFGRYMYMPTYGPAVMRTDARTYLETFPGNTLYNVTGTEGDSFVTVQSGNIPLSEITAVVNVPFAVMYDDLTIKPCLLTSVDSANSKLNIYPPLEHTITAGQIGSIRGDSLHLTKLGFKGWAQHIFNYPLKYADKKVVLSKFDPNAYGSGVATSMVAIAGSGRMAASVANSNAQATRREYNCVNVWDTLLEVKSGRQITLATGEAGYCEVLVSGMGTSNAKWKNVKDAGFEMYIEFWLDGVLSKTHIKTDNFVENVRFDFPQSTSLVVVFYYNKIRINEDYIIVHDITCWKTTMTLQSIVQAGKAIVQNMDSWGTYYSGIVRTELIRLLTARDGSAATFTNTSLGGTKAQWGVDNYAANVVAHSPKIVLHDFGINDEVAAITIADYTEDINQLIALAVTNEIIPIFCWQVPLAATYLLDKQLYVMQNQV